MLATRLRERGREFGAQRSTAAMDIAAEDAAVEKARQQHDAAEKGRGQPQLRHFPSNAGSAAHRFDIIVQ